LWFSVYNVRLVYADFMLWLICCIVWICHCNFSKFFSHCND